jgi:hypothetical protein
MFDQAVNLLKHIEHIDRLTAFGLLAVGLMLLFYALEHRSPIYVAAFAGACLMGSIYGFLQGAWPFGLVEAIWSAVAVRRWWGLHCLATDQRRVANVANFMAALRTIARLAGQGSYAFADAQDRCLGFVQFIIDSDRKLTIHRIWTLQSGKGDGAAILRNLCALADRHGVELALKVIPIGRKPYPMSRENLKAWYERFGFQGPRWKMVRTPLTRASANWSESPEETSPTPSTPS